MNASQFASSLELALGLVFVATAHAPCDDVRDESEEERDQKKDTNAEWPVTESILKSLEAVCGWGTSVDSLEVVEETWVADSIAVQCLFCLTGKVFNSGTDVLDSLLIVGVHVCCSLINLLEVLVA